MLIQYKQIYLTQNLPFELTIQIIFIDNDHTILFQ